MRRAMLMAAGLLVAMGVCAETIEVPCEDYQRVMNVRMACDAIPMVPVDSVRWQKRLYDRCLTEHNYVPWKGGVPAACLALQPDRSEIATATPGQPSPEAACRLPPWKRPKGLVCK